MVIIIINKILLLSHGASLILHLRIKGLRKQTTRLKKGIPAAIERANFIQVSAPLPVQILLTKRQL